MAIEHRLLDKEKLEEAMRAPSHFAMLRTLGFEPLGYWFRKKPAERPAWDTRPVQLPPEAVGLLWPGDVIDLTWDAGERAKVVAYLKAGKTFMGYMGYSWCRLCELTAPPRAEDDHHCAPWETLGTKDLFDGLFVWPEGYAHYVEEHGVKPHQAFINHALGRK